MKNNKSIKEMFITRKNKLTPEIVKLKFQEFLNKKIKYVEDSIEKNTMPEFAINITETSFASAHIIALNPGKFQELILKEIIKLLQNKNPTEPFTIEIIKNVLSTLEKKVNEFILGYVYLTNLYKTHGYMCNHSWETTQVAAEKGNGPLLYSISASFVKKEKNEFKRITPHRSSVENSARNVWKVTHQHREDFEKYPLDDIDNPKTQTKIDDCPVHSLGLLGLTKKDNIFLNFAYEIKTPINYVIFIDSYIMSLEKIVKNIYFLLTSQLESVHNSITIKKIMHLINNNIKRFGKLYFDNKYLAQTQSPSFKLK